MTRTYLVRGEHGAPLARYITTEPDDWTDDDGVFHKNESSWCSGTIFDAPEEPGRLDQIDVLDRPKWDELNRVYNARDTCPCMHLTFELETA